MYDSDDKRIKITPLVVALPRALRAPRPLAWLAMSLLFCAVGAHAEPVTVASASSPGKVLKVSLQLDGGNPSYRVERLGQTVVAERANIQIKQEPGILIQVPAAPQLADVVRALSDEASAVQFPMPDGRPDAFDVR